MRCSRVRLLIDDHVDGLLPADDAERVRDHLDACRECHGLAECARAASTSLAAWGDVAPPADCFDRILARIDTLPPEALERPARVRRLDLFRAQVRRWAAPSLAAAAAGIGALLMFEQGSARAPQRRIAFPVAATAMSSPASAPGWTGPTTQPTALRPGEEYVHLVGVRCDDGVRRVRTPRPLGPTERPGDVRTVPAEFFDTPR